MWADFSEAVGYAERVLREPGETRQVRCGMSCSYALLLERRMVYRITFDLVTTPVTASTTTTTVNATTDTSPVHTIPIAITRASVSAATTHTDAAIFVRVSAPRVLTKTTLKGKARAADSSRSCENAASQRQVHMSSSRGQHSLLHAVLCVGSLHRCELELRTSVRESCGGDGMGWREGPGEDDK
ncbi:hypothetical protein BDZ97DRAFT_1814031 [Flammula alnicola]|nr:hypothetical protein BDZ97DRAFT_1814031 [Flammula alnicola]